MGGGGARGRKTVTTRSAANTTVYARRVAALGAGEEERSRGPLLLRHGVVVRGEGGCVVDGTEGPGSFDELNKLVVASLQPLQTVGASESGAEGEGRARRVKVEDRGRGRGDGGGGGGGEKVCGGVRNRRGKGRSGVGKGGTRGSCSEGQGRERHAKERRKTRGGRDKVWTNGEGGQKFLGKKCGISEVIGSGGIDGEGGRGRRRRIG